jgi:pyruvate/oxaloacetate carboxyltransferase
MLHTPLKAQIDAQKVVGEHPVAQDVVSLFCARASENGISAFCIEDPEHDAERMATAIAASRAAGIHAQAALRPDAFPDAGVLVTIAQHLASAGADSICLLDSAGTLLPFRAAELVNALRLAVKVPIAVHAHGANGLSEMSCLKAIEAGATILDATVDDRRGSNGLPSASTLRSALSDTRYDSGLDEGALLAAFDVRPDAHALGPTYSWGRRPEALMEVDRPREPRDLEAIRAEAGDLATSEDDLLTYAMYPEDARVLLQKRRDNRPSAPEVAAIIAVMAPSPNGARSASPSPSAASAWKHAGRQRVVRGRQ